MTAHDAHPLPPHAEAEALAWYLGGSLSAAEQREVEQHLQGCEQCRAELESLRAVRVGVRAALDMEPGPSARLRHAVMRGIAGEPVPAETRGLLSRVHDWLRLPMAPRWTAAAALLLIAVQAGMLVETSNRLRQVAPEITTRAVQRAPTRLQISFDPKATEAKVRELLLALGARVVDGPTPAGSYVIELAGTDPKALGAKLAAARAQQDVVSSISLSPP
jgi:anti-sigma factor RsiW